jgi:hypothetical protein
MAQVYIHKKLDTNEIFYVGISKRDNGGRANDKNKRSRYWKFIAEKHGFYAEILHTNITFDEAIVIEKEMIKKLGKLIDGSGILCNITDGGEGCVGFPITDEYRKKISLAQKGRKGKSGEENNFWGKKHTEESRKKMSDAQKKRVLLYGAPKGKPMSEQQKQKLRDRMIGGKLSEEHKKKIGDSTRGKKRSEETKRKMKETNYMAKMKGSPLISGENSNGAKKCLHIPTNKEYGSLMSACKELGLSYHTQRAYLKRNHKNKQFKWI